MSVPLKKIMLFWITLLLAVASVSAANYTYIPNVIPHTRFNNLRDNCFYYYGYGSCNVTRNECDGVSIGQNKWINLGDACNRNTAPLIDYSNKMQGIEGTRLTLDVNCIDDDPVMLNVTGWMNNRTVVLDYDDAGNHEVEATCIDSFGKTASAKIEVIVVNANRAPLFRSIEA